MTASSSPASLPLEAPQIEPLVSTSVEVEGVRLLRVVLEEADSTNLEVRRRWERRTVAGEAPQPLTVRACRQTGGMGRGGRFWESPEGGLWLSLAWPQRHELAAYACLPLVTGLAVVQALETLGVRQPAVKWPNDILVGERKLCGLLCQSAPVAGAPMIIVGIGINGNFASSVLGKDLRTPAISLREVFGEDTDLDALEARVVEQVVKGLLRYELRGWDAGFMAEMGRHLAWVGQQVECTDLMGKVLARGVLLGIDVQGHLMVEAPDTLHRLAAGEITLRARRA